MKAHPYNVLCPKDGKVALTEEQYLRQLDAVDDFWKCPTCGGRAEFDDASYEAATEMDAWADDYGAAAATTDVHGRLYFLCPGLDDEGDSAAPHGSAERQEGDHETRAPSTRDEANLLSSATAVDGEHYPVIDFDIPVRLVGSSTDGNTHVYIDKAVPWEKFLAVLEALRDAGLVQDGYVSHARERGQAFVRPPWVKKRERQAPPKKVEPDVMPDVQDEDLPF